MSRNRKPANAAETVRLMVPVDRGLAEFLAQVAKAMKVSQAHVVESLLECTLENRQHWAAWVAYRSGLAMVSNFTERSWQHQGESTYVQAFLDPHHMQEIEELAAKLRLPVPRFAESLLESAAWEHEWVMKLVQTNVGGKLCRFLRKVSNADAATQTEVNSPAASEPPRRARASGAA